MDKLGVGIIGAGNISSAYLKLAPMFRALDVRAVADLRIETAQAQADAFGVRASSVEDLLGSDDIDVVVNLTIPAAHFEVSKAVLESGKHAYSEKPFVLTLEEGQALQDIAAPKGLRIGSAPDTFLGGVHQLARARLDEGLIGDVIAGTCHVMGHGMEHWHPNPDFFFLPGAGPVLDIGPYYITNLVQLIGPVKRVTSLANATFAERTITTDCPRQGETVPVKTPTNIHALLEFHNGATITLSASWDIWAHRHANMELYGVEGSMFVPDPNFFGGVLESSGANDTIAEVPGWDHPFGVANDDRHTPPRANYRAAGLADMVEALVDGRNHRCSYEMALHVVEVMTSIIAAGEQGVWKNITTTCERPAPLGPSQAEELLA